jgi:glycosyltransferase involved in cell wall biosynthesis
MKIAFISTMCDWQWGGSEELWSQSATRLKKEGHDVRASVAYWPQMPDKLIALAQLGIPIETHSWWHHAGPARRAWDRFSLSSRRGYGRLKRFNPDLVVISQGYNSGGFAWAKVCREAGIPYIMIVHCNSEHWWFGEKLGEAVASYTAARSVFCVSQGNLDLLQVQLGEPLSNAELVWNPYNVSPGHTAPWPDENMRWRLACVARIDLASKGQDLLLQTLARPEWRNRAVELNLYGSGPDEPALRRFVATQQLKNVQFRGQVNDIQAIWEQNHLLVLPSRYEGLPLVLVEAMWCGRPAVVTDVGGNAELCVDGETGFVVGAATLSSFSHAMNRAWERREEWHEMGWAARTRAETLIPKDPIALFCERLKVSAAARYAEAPVC